MGARGLDAYRVHATFVLRHATNYLAVTILTLSSTLAVSCHGSGNKQPHKGDIPALQSQPPPAPRATVPAADDALESGRIQLIEQLPQCEVDQLGPVLEVGTPSEQARRGFAANADRSEPVERNGDGFTRVYERQLVHTLWLDEPIERPRVAVRLVGAAASRLTVLLDKTVVGTTKLTRGELVTRSFPAMEGIVEPGRHTVTLEFRGKPTDRDDPSAEIDWIHVGQPMDGDTIPTVPTLRTLVADQNLGGIPKRAIVLRAPSLVRCPLLLTAPAHLKVSVGFWGTGHGLGEIRLLEDGQAPVTLRQQRTQGGNGASWTPLDIDLSTYAHRVVHLEMRALRASQHGRVVFGEPSIQQTETPPSPEAGRAKVVLVVVASGLWRRKIPPWAPIGNVSAIGHLLPDAVVFQNYQASSTVPAAVMASLVTGLGPVSHTLQDPLSRLPQSVGTLQRFVKLSSGRTAMFTGVPNTFETFGFASNWDEYQAVSPIKDLPAQEPLTRASRWLQHELEVGDNAKRFLLVHIRGMHPPWDLTKEEVAALQPSEYGGPIDGRRGGITLARIRKQTHKSQRRLTDEDWTRLESLTTAAIGAQMQAFDQLVNVLKRYNLWQSSLVIFMGDVGAGEPPNVPYEPRGTLRGDQLTVPLLIKFPGNEYAGHSVERPVTTVDISKTILAALGLEASEGMLADDLEQVAAGRAPLAERPLVSTLGNAYASRLENWLLFGELGREPNLCELYVDPACTNNRFADRPLTAKAAWLWSRNELLRMKAIKGAPARESATIDADTAAGLTVWGDIEQ